MIQIDSNGIGNAATVRAWVSAKEGAMRTAAVGSVAKLVYENLTRIES